MSPISITFTTPTVSGLAWTDSFKDLRDEEIEDIIVHCRFATASFEAELSDRCEPRKDRALEDHYDTLFATAKTFNESGLTKEHNSCLDDLSSSLRESKEDAQNKHHTAKAATQYLWCISRVLGWSYALLIFCALSKSNVQKLPQDHRVKLIKRMNQYHIGIDSYLPRVRKQRKRKRNRNDVEDATTETLSIPTTTAHTNPLFTPTPLSNFCEVLEAPPVFAPPITPATSVFDIPTTKHPFSRLPQCDGMNVHPDQSHSTPPALDRDSQIGNSDSWYNLVMNNQTNRRTLQLPQLEHVLTYFNNPDFIEAFSSEELAQVVEGCLSSSQFSDLGWKRKILTTAEGIMGVEPWDPQLSARLKLREKFLSCLFPVGPEQRLQYAPDITKCDLTPVDSRLNAYCGEMMLFNAQKIVERNELLKACYVLEKFKPFDSKNPSTLEQSVMQQISFFKGKISRFAGHFLEAKDHLEPLSLPDALRSKILYGITTHLIAVYYKLSNIDEAMCLASAASEELQLSNRLSRNRERRLKLSLAETHLMKALWIVKKSNVEESRSKVFRNFTLSKHARDSLETASDIYEELQKSYQESRELSKVGRLNNFRISVGLAMISHLEGHLEVAFSKWELALSLAQSYWGSDFAMMISLYSMSEITLKLDKITQS
ncbi:MAG: hypothetical protein Q9187_003895 [Circinaria calcarea]